MAKMILGLVGPIACGKDTVKKYLENRYNAESCRFSSILRDILSRIKVPTSRENVQKISTILRQNFGEDVLARVIADDVFRFKSDVVVVDGVRRAADIVHLQKLPEFSLLAIDASPKIRYERLVKRNENVGDDQKTYEQFLKDHEYETELDIPALMKKSKYRVDNGGSFADLYAQVDAIIAKIK